MLDGFQIQNPLVWLSRNTSGTCWLSFMGFCDVDFVTENEGTGLSYPSVRALPGADPLSVTLL